MRSVPSGALGSDAALAAAVIGESDGELGARNEVVVVVTAYPLPYLLVLTTARKTDGRHWACPSVLKRPRFRRLCFVQIK